MSDPVIASIRAQRMALNMTESSEKRPTGWRRWCQSIYRESVFLFGAAGALLPGVLMLLVAAYATVVGISFGLMLALKLIGSP